MMRNDNRKEGITMRHFKDSLDKIRPKEKTDCEKCRELLFDYVSDVTDPAQSEWMESHLRSCPSCETEYEEIREMLLVAEDPEPQMPDTFQDALHLKLNVAAEEMKAEQNRSLKDKFARWMEPEVWKEAFLGFGNGTFRDKMERFGHLGGWKIMAPAMVCVALSVGVFSTGLYHRWMAADDVLTADYQTEESLGQTAKPKATKKPSGTATAKPKSSAAARATASAKSSSKPAASAAAKSSSKPSSTVKPTNKATNKSTSKASSTPKPTSKPTAAQVVEDAPVAPPAEEANLVEAPAAAPVVENESVQDSGADGAAVYQMDESADSPMDDRAVKASGGTPDSSLSGGAGGGSSSAPVNQGVNSILSDPMPEAMRTFAEKTYLIRVDDPEDYLNAYQSAAGLDWKAKRLEDVNPKEIAADSREDAVVLRISDEEWDRFSTYTLEKGILPASMNQDGDEKEVIVIVTGYGD